MAKKILLIVILILNSGAFAQRTFFEKTSVSKKHRVGFYILGGIPDNRDRYNPITILINEAYMVGYSENRSNPIWSAYHVDRIRHKNDGMEVNFETDHDRPALFHADLRTSVKVSGDISFRIDGEPDYDRGHLTPNDAIQKEWGRLAQLETFFMSNISPQIKNLNSGHWRTLEQKINNELTEKFDDIWVVSGTIYDRRSALISDTRVQIPKAFFMLISSRSFDQKKRKAVFQTIAFNFPNDASLLEDKELRDFVTTIDTVEKAAKLDFFDDLPRSVRFPENIEADFDVWFGET